MVRLYDALHARLITPQKKGFISSHFFVEMGGVEPTYE